jgi:hypothetical protein
VGDRVSDAFGTVTTASQTDAGDRRGNGLELRMQLQEEPIA